MKIVVAIDSFKGSLSSGESANAVRAAAEEVLDSPQVVAVPLADGGEGTSRALIEGLGGETVRVAVTGPLGDRVMAEYGITDGTAVMEMSVAAGITLIPRERLNPEITTTSGVGEMILDAISRGCRRFIIGIGGSATNDGGAGMLEALGFKLLDRDGRQIRRGAIGLGDLHTIDGSCVSPLLAECEFRVASDVTNPLLGELGCSRVFAPQKGADEASVERMEKMMGHYADKTKEFYPLADENAPGAGAAGGLGFALRVFLGAELLRGVELILDTVGINDHLASADLVITGEGRLDAQTAMGKAPVGVAARAKARGIPVIAFSGCVGGGAEAVNACGIDAFFPILRRICTEQEAMDKTTAYENLKATARQVFMLMRAMGAK